MLAFWIIPFVVAALATPHKNPKNMHSPCQIVINEFSYSNSFIEIAKLCYPGQYNPKKGLTRHHVFIVDQDGILRFRLNLSSPNKELKDFGALPNEPTPRHRRQWFEKKSNQKQGKKGSSSHDPEELSTDEETDEELASSPSRSAPIPSSRESFIGAESCEQTFRGCGDDSRFRRNKRDARELQPYVRGLKAFALDGFEFILSDSYGIFLICFPDKEHRLGVTSFKIGNSLSEEQINSIKNSLHDFLLIVPPETVNDQSILTSFIPDKFPFRFLIQDADMQASYSFSKCDSDISVAGANGFVHAEPTKEQRNSCKKFQEPVPFRFKGKTIRPQSKEFIVNVITNLNRLIDSKEWKKLNIIQASAQLVNLSPDTVYKILNEYSKEKHFLPPGKRVRLSPSTDIDDEKKKLIYTTVTGYYKRNLIPYFKNVFKDWITAVRTQHLQKIEAQVNNNEQPDELYHCSASSFAKILKNQGYTYGKVADRDSQIFRPKNIEWRKRYLRAKEQYDADPNWDVIYQDETWIDTHARANKGWRLKRFESFIQRREFAFETAKVSRGARLIVLAVGGENGFIPGTTEVFVVVNSKKKKPLPQGQDVQLARDTEIEDYHMNVDGNRFFRWMEKVLRALHRPTVIVMDNCSVHKVKNYPTKYSSKADMLAWLQNQKKQNVPISEDISDNTKLTKPLLLVIIDRIVKQKNLADTKVEQLVQDNGHRILLTPPYMPELQPIELVWSDIKREVREKNVEQTIALAKSLAVHELSTYSTEMWRNHIRHVKKVQKEFIEGDKVFEFNENSEREEREALPLGPVEITIIDVFAGTFENEEELEVYE